MRSLKKNQQRLQYATYSDQITIYERDEDGDIIYVNIDGEQVPTIAGEITGYNEPVIFSPISLCLVVRPSLFAVVAAIFIFPRTVDSIN